MARGGKRAGAGRPKMHDEPMERVRVPASMMADVKRFVASKGFTLPVYSARVSAGYPMPAEDTIDDRVDIATLLGGNLEDAFIVYANGDSMKDAGIFDGDALLVQPHVKPGNGKIVVAAVDGQVTVKFLIVKKGKAFLMPANPAYDEIPIDSEHGVTIWGVVETSLRMHRH
jgi:DNA polymerase V